MNLGGDVIFHQHQSYLNNNNIHFPNFDFPVYLNSDDEMTEHWYSSTPKPYPLVGIAIKTVSYYLRGFI